MDLNKTESTPWHQQAACRGTDPSIVFSEAPEAIHAMRQICADCPVRSECLDDVAATGDEHFVRGGLTPAERGGAGLRPGRPGECRICGIPFIGRPNRQICFGRPCGQALDAARKRANRARRNRASHRPERIEIPDTPEERRRIVEAARANIDHTTRSTEAQAS